MTIRNDLIQAGRTWIKSFGDRATPPTDANVKNGDKDFQRPALPYCVVYLDNYDMAPSVLADEILQADSGGNPTEVAGGKRTAVLVFDLFGDAATEWGTNASLELTMKPAQDALRALGVVFQKTNGGVQSLTTGMSARREIRGRLEVNVFYSIRGTVLTGAEGVTEALTVDANIDLPQDDADASPLNLTKTYTL